MVVGMKSKYSKRQVNFTRTYVDQGMTCSTSKYVTRTLDLYRNMLVSMRYNSFWIVWGNRVCTTVGSRNEIFF